MLPLWRDAQVAFCRRPHQLTGSPCVRQAKDIWASVLLSHIIVSGRPPTPSDDELPIRFVVIKLIPPSHFVSHYLTAITNYTYTHSRGHLRNSADLYIGLAPSWSRRVLQASVEDSCFLMRCLRQCVLDVTIASKPPERG